MPFKSKAQQRFLEAHPEKVGGRGKLKEWETATDFSTLPEKKPNKFAHARTNAKRTQP